VLGDAVFSFAETQVKLKKKHFILTRKYLETEATDYNNNVMKKLDGTFTSIK
jgi:hypothetical protein